jgi:hypothetical protein
MKGEDYLLSVEEVKEKRDLTKQLFSLSRVECIIFWQYSRTRWLSEGDANT